MKKLNIVVLFVLTSVIFAMSSCNSNSTKSVKELSDEITEEVNESEVLLNFLEKSGDIINDKAIPSILKSDEVFANTANYHIIDVRKKESYIAGHIDGAVNVDCPDLVNYMKNSINPSNYKKIVFVSNSNHTAAYTSMMFRLLGYGNTYSMKWGMSSCDKTTLDKKWGKNTSNEFLGKLETKGNSKGKKGNYPTIKTGKKSGYEILESRVEELLKTNKFKVKAKELFENPDKYYIINYWPMNFYIKGHIPGAIQYSPKKSLTKSTHLSTLPTDKPIAIYCFTGQHASYVAAYLQVLGYDAYAVSYSANGFMHSKLISDEIGHAFNKKTHFVKRELVTGEKPGLKTISPKNQTEEIKPEVASPPPATQKKKKQEEEEEGGC